MKNPIKKPSWWDEFKTFAIKGNAMALAVGTIIGGAFSTITKSLTNDLIMPVVNIFLGGADFSEAKIALPRMPWVEPTYETVVNEAGEEVVQEVLNYLTYGNFISAVINFAILALVVFWLVKGLNKLAEMGKKKEEEAVAAEPPAEPEPTKEELLLAEIRDLLKEKN
jgi:large conductance mechanosensitive channel